ncbi:MAG: hypothetical protein KAT68_09115 [Bacteroidales bacterium]|nr:hypothetical protein [Bacteroidales bacterium]
MSEKDNIELRSEKVRNIIGQIPPRIIRSGISVIFLVVIIMLVGSYFFKYSYIVKSEIVFTKENNIITGIIKIPANEISKVKKGQETFVNFNNIPNMNNEILKSEIELVSTKLEITNEKAFYSASIKIPKTFHTNSGGQIEFTNTIKGNAEIITDEISFFERIIQPVKSLLLEDKSEK